MVPFTKAAVPEVHIAQGYVIVEPPAEIEGEEGPLRSGKSALFPSRFLCRNRLKTLKGGNGKTFLLEGRVAIVTGGGGEIGSAICGGLRKKARRSLSPTYPSRKRKR